MLVRIPSLALLVLLLAANRTHAASAAFPPEYAFAETRLVKVGEGTLRWMFIRVYDGALYLDASDPKRNPLDDTAKRLELAYAVGISAEQFRESGNTILRRNVDPSIWEAIRDRVEAINAAYVDVGDGDRYALTYLPGTGTTLSLNGTDLVTVEGADFAKAYFTIWLGEDPAQKSFKRQLLEGLR